MVSWEEKHAPPTFRSGGNAVQQRALPNLTLIALAASYFAQIGAGVFALAVVARVRFGGAGWCRPVDRFGTTHAHALDRQRRPVT